MINNKMVTGDIQSLPVSQIANGMPNALRVVIDIALTLID